MPYSSEAQRKYFNANREKLEAEGVDVDEWNKSTKGKKLPLKAEKEEPKSKLPKNAQNNIDVSFLPDYTPEQLKEMGVYKEVYGAKDAPRLASLPEWPAHWYNEADPHGWLQWYDRHSKGRRIEDDKRQIKRWISFKARHGGKAFRENPTPRRAFALRNWGIDPAKLVDDPEALKAVMDEYKEKQYSKKMEKSGSSIPYWYGSETSNYNNTKKPGIYHGLPIRESDSVGWFQNPQKSIPRNELKRILKGLAKVKEIDISGENKDTGYLEFGWSTNKDRGVADDAMTEKINSILYKEKMNKVSFLPKLAKDEKPGLWANIRAKRKRGEPPAKPGDKAYPDKEQWSELTKKEAGNIAPSVLPNKVPDKPFVPSVMDGHKQMMGNVIKNIKASDPNAKSLLTNKNLWKFVGSIPSQYGDLLTGDMKGLSKTYNRFGANIKEGRCWDGYEPVPGKKPYAPDSCRKKTKKKDKSKKADLFESLEKTPFGNTAAAGLIGLGVVPAMAALGGGYGYLFPDKPNEGEDLQKKKIETAKRQALVAAILSSGLLLGKGIRDDISASMKKADLSFLPKVAKSPAWQRSEGKNSEGGLNAKGRASYNRENGGNLKAPVTEKNPSGKREKRQNSFCSRMCGMKKSRTSAETKNDPDSRINKALRKWRCRCG